MPRGANDGDNWLWGSSIYLFGDAISSTNNDVLDGQGGNECHLTSRLLTGACGVVGRVVEAESLDRAESLDSHPNGAVYVK